MASNGTVSFKKFEWDRGGYSQVLHWGSVHRLTNQAAQRVKAQADANLSSGGYMLQGHEVKTVEGKLAKGCVVRTKTDQARYTQAKRKSLTKALGAGKAS